MTYKHNGIIVLRKGVKTHRVTLFLLALAYQEDLNCLFAMVYYIVLTVCLFGSEGVRKQLLNGHRVQS